MGFHAQVALWPVVGKAKGPPSPPQPRPGQSRGWTPGHQTPCPAAARETRRTPRSDPSGGQGGDQRRGGQSQAPSRAGHSRRDGPRAPRGPQRIGQLARSQKPSARLLPISAPPGSGSRSRPSSWCRLRAPHSAGPARSRPDCPGRARPRADAGGRGHPFSALHPRGFRPAPARSRLRPRGFRTPRTPPRATRVGLRAPIGDPRLPGSKLVPGCSPGPRAQLPARDRAPEMRGKGPARPRGPALPRLRQVFGKGQAGETVAGSRAGTRPALGTAVQWAG